MKIGIISGSIRRGRKSDQVADWVFDQAQQRSDAEFEVLHLADFDVPLLEAETVPGAANKQYDDERVQRWSAAIDACDGYIFVSPEYNHSVPGAFKNAFDSLGPEWAGKAAAIVSYGADSGVRAVEHWRQIIANFQTVVVRAQVSLSLFTEFGEDGVTPEDRHAGEISTLFDQLIDQARKQRA